MPDLETDFNIAFNKDDEQPVNDVTIYNLTPETIRNIGDGQTLILNAGYNGNLGNVLSGKISDIETSSDKVDRALKLMVTPDISVILTQIVSLSYAPGTQASYIAKDLLSKVGLEVGTIKLTSDINYTDGKVISGTIDSALKQLVAETNSFMFVRCNIIYIVDSVYEIDTGILLNASTGLIGSPEAYTDSNGATGYRVTSLLNPMLTVGSVFRLESRYLSGLFRVENGTHSGNFSTVVNCYPTDEVSRYVPPVKAVAGAGENTPKGRIWTFLINKGFSKAATAGVMGNMELESGYDPSAENSSSGAYGLLQWLGGRREGLEAYATANNCAANDMQLQLDYFYIEVTTGAESDCFPIYTDLPSLDAFKSLTDPEQAARLFEQAFERSGGDAMGARIEYALAVYAWDGGNASGSSNYSGTNHFSEGAFKCACGCGLDCVQELKDKLNQVCENTGQEFVITSAARCEYQNNIDDGVPNSEHLYGRACDGYIPGAGVDYLYNAAQNVGLGTIRYYSSGFVHCQTSAYDDILD